jgi:hypothetical protein
MKQTLSAILVLTLAVTAMGQEKETTRITTTTTTVAKPSGFDLLGGETWNVTDATPFTCGAVDLRLATRWTEDAPTSPGNGRGRGEDQDDAWTVTPAVVWGVAEGWELSFNLPIRNVENLSDAPDGNYDSYFGALWRFKEQEGFWPAMALGSSLRIPTGEDSNGVDWELRLALTNEYDSGIRSHLNFFGITANGDNIEELRHFQYGAVAGLDGPLCSDGAVRWVVDYMYRISDHDGGGGLNIGEAGFQWQINECNKLGLSFQASLDHADDASDIGAALTYAYTILN